MIGRLRLALAFAAAAVVAIPALPSRTAAQETAGSRYRVLIPPLFPAEGTDDGFGKDVAKELRKLVDQMATHQAIEEDEVNDKLDQFKIDKKNLDCIQTRQLGAQINAQVALCASYEKTGDKQYQVEDVEIWDLGSQQKYDVDSFAATERDDGKKKAAQEIFSAFDDYNQQVRFRAFCFEYAASSNWADALRNCRQALEMNPGDTGVRYQVADILRKQADGGENPQENYEASLEQLHTLLENDPYNTDALQLAGFVATKLGNNEEGREYYGRYLELNPGAVAVRRNIAYKMFEAGDPQGAMLFIQEGRNVEDNPDLAMDFGNYAFAAADRLSREQAVATEDSDASTGISPEVADLYRNAIDAYMVAFDAKGDSMSVSALKNVISAYIQLGELDQAVATGKRILDIHSEEPGLWALYADALQRSGDTEGALAALDKVEELDSDYQDLYMRRGNWLLQSGKVDRAVSVLGQAVQRGQDPNRVALMIFADAHANGVRKNDYGYAERMISAAKEFDVQGETLRQLNFWLGYSIFQQAMKAQEPQTAATAKAALPRFQRALELFQAARGYEDANRAKLIDAANQYVEIQQAVLKRAGGG